MAYPKLVSYVPTQIGPTVPGQGLASLVPQYVLDDNFSSEYPANQQYCWIKENGVLIFTIGTDEPPNLEKAYLYDKYGQQLVDPSLNKLYASNFAGIVIRYLEDGGDHLIDSIGRNLFTIA